MRQTSFQGSFEWHMPRLAWDWHCMLRNASVALQVCLKASSDLVMPRVPVSASVCQVTAVRQAKELAGCARLGVMPLVKTWRTVRYEHRHCTSCLLCCYTRAVSKTSSQLACGTGNTSLMGTAPKGKLAPLGAGNKGHLTFTSVLHI